MIKEIIRDLEPEQHKALMEAFNSLNSELIKLPDNKFIGVHVVVQPAWKVLEEKGYFIYGELS